MDAGPSPPAKEGIKFPQAIPADFGIWASSNTVEAGHIALAFGASVPQARKLSQRPVALSSSVVSSDSPSPLVIPG